TRTAAVSLTGVWGGTGGRAPPGAAASVPGGRRAPPRRWNPWVLGARGPRRLRPVRDHQRDLGGVGAFLRRLDQRCHIGSATGDQDGDAFFGHALTARDRGVRDRRRHPPARSSRATA